MYKKILVLCCVIVFAIAIRLFNLNEMGRTLDEDYIVQKGHKFVQLARNGDFQDPYWYSIPDHPPLGNYIYGIFSQLDTVGFDKSKQAMDFGYYGVPLFNYDLTYSRLASVLFSVITIALVMLICLRYFSLTTALASGIILSTIPFYLGHSQIVSLDILFSAFFTLAIASLLYFFDKPSYKKAVLAGALIGVVQLVKQTGIILYILFLIMYITQFFFFAKQKAIKIKYFLTIIAASILSAFAIWPMPWFHPSQFLSFTVNMWFKGGGYPEWFMGRLMIAPIFYYFVYVLIIIPVGVLAFFALGGGVIFKNKMKSKRWIYYAMALWFSVPLIVQSLYIGRQDKLRYVIEIIPPFSIIAGIGIDAFVKTYVHKLKYRLLLLALFVSYLTLPLWKLTPYYLEYFNELVGGTSTVYHLRLFQMGGGGPGLKAAGIFLEKHATKGESVGIAADPGRNIKHGDGLQFSEYDNEKEYDWVVVNYYLVIRSGFDEEPVKRKYKLVHTVYADGAELVHVYTRK